LENKTYRFHNIENLGDYLNTQEIGKQVRQRRRILGIDQKTAAELSNVSVHTLSDIESGKGNPSIKVLSAVLDALGLKLQIQINRVPMLGKRRGVAPCPGQCLWKPQRMP
jgi:DNA-binding XRE family transcriptional regulator